MHSSLSNLDVPISWREKSSFDVGAMNDSLAMTIMAFFGRSVVGMKT